MTPRGIRPIERAVRVCQQAEVGTPNELAAMPETQPMGAAGLLSLEESLRLFAEAASLPSERS